MNNDVTITEADILNEIIAPSEPAFSPEVARSLLGWHFTERTTQRIGALLQTNNRGDLSFAEREELEKYLRVGQLVDLLQAKARSSLKSPRRD